MGTIKTARTELAGTSGASLAPIPNENYGFFHKDEYYEEPEDANVLPSSLAVLYNNLIDILMESLHIGKLVGASQAPSFMVGPALSRDADYHRNLKLNYAETHPNTLNTRARNKLLDAEFNSSLNFKLTNMSDGGIQIGIRCGEATTLGSLVRQAGVSSHSFGPAGNNGPSVYDLLMENFRNIGYNPDSDSYDMHFPLSQFMDRDSEGNFPAIARLKDARVTVSLSRNNEPYKMMDMTTYTTTMVTSYLQLPNDVQRKMYLFNHVFPQTTADIYLTFSITKDESQFITQSNNKVSLVDVADWTSNMVQQGLTGSYSSFVTPVAVALSVQLDHNRGVEAKPRTGVLGLMIKPSTLALVKLPSGVDNIVENYEDRLKAHDDNGSYKHVVTKRNDHGNMVKVESGERVVCVDWTSNNLTINSGGRTEFVDLTDWGPATPWHLKRMIEDNSTGVDKSACGLVVARSLRVLSKLGLINMETLTAENVFVGMNTGYAQAYARSLLTGDGLLAGLRGVLEKYIDTVRFPSSSPAPNMFSDHVTSTDTSETLLRIYYKFRNLNSKSPFPVLRYLGKVLGMAYDATKSMKDTELCAVLGLSIETVLTWRANIEVWHEYCQTEEHYAKLTNDDAANRYAYGKQPEDQDDLPPDFKPAAIPNLKSDLTLMPHQAKAAFSLEKIPKLAVLDVDAGGGKTIIILTDVLRKLDKGVCDTPAVFCPSHLLANYVQDGNFSTTGALNIVPINSTTVDSFGRDYFEKLAKSGPPNTLFVVDYDFLKWKPFWTSYGTMMYETYGNAQWVRSLGIDAVWLDESHYLKNDSGRTESVRQALVDVPYKTLATGTMLATKVGDVINQMMLLDPGIFGTEDRFATMYGGDGGLQESAHDFEADKAIPMKAWIATQMQKNVCIVKGRRKEWAALLPRKYVNFHWVELSEAQRKIYKAVLEATVDEIRSDPKIMAIIGQQNEDFADQLDAMLNRYLQRIERVLTAPGADELSISLTPEEMISPKGIAIGRIVKKHIADKIPGKILVFTSYIESAKAVIAALPPEIQKLAILYTADRKMECREEFEKNPNKLIMVGVENSMNTGINAQFASRLIRVESIYSPGMLEQGESRINRPNAKKGEFRTGLYMDWVLVDESIDVTKSGRLMWRALDAAKFNNPHTPAYQALPDLSPIRMNIDSIMANNSFEEVLPEYLSTYLELENEVKADEIEAYKKRHPKLGFVPQPSSGLLAGSALLKEVPYVPGGDLANMDKLNLIPLLEFERENGGSGIRGRDSVLIDQYCHTDQGDSSITRVLKDHVIVNIGGNNFKIDKGTAFINLKKVTSVTEIRNAMSKVLSLDIRDTNAEGYKSDFVPKSKPALVPVTPDVEKSPSSLPDGRFSTTAPEGRLLFQVSDGNGDWLDVNTVSDSKRGLSAKEQNSAYKLYLDSKVAKYEESNDLVENSISGRLIDAKGVTVYSTDGNYTQLEQTPFKKLVTEPVLPDVDDTEEEDEGTKNVGDTKGKHSPAPEAVDNGELVLLPCFYNEFFSLILNATDTSAKELGFDPLDHGFKAARACGYLELKRWQQAKDLGIKLRASGLEVPESFYTQLEFLQLAMKTNRTHFQQYRHLRVNMSDLRMFQLEKKRKLPIGEVRPFFTICDGTVFVMVDPSVTPSWSKLRTSVRVTGSQWHLDDPTYILLSDKKASILQVVTAISKDYPIADLDWVKGEVKNMNNASRSKDLT